MSDSPIRAGPEGLLAAGERVAPGELPRRTASEREPRGAPHERREDEPHQRRARERAAELSRGDPFELRGPPGT